MLQNYYNPVTEKWPDATFDAENGIHKLKLRDGLTVGVRPFLDYRYLECGKLRIDDVEWEIDFTFDGYSILWIGTTMSEDDIYRWAEGQNITFDSPFSESDCFSATNFVYSIWNSLYLTYCELCGPYIAAWLTGINMIRYDTK